MRIVSLVILLSALSGRVSAQNNKAWTPTNTMLTVASSAAIVGDCLTTLHFMHNGGLRRPLANGGTFRAYEQNPLMPKYPTRGRIIGQCAVALVANAVFAKLLPNPWRNIHLSLIVGIESYMVYHNVQMWGFSFSL